MLSNGISKLDLKRRNRMQILRLLRRCGPTSRIDIARDIGITKAAVTIITNEMIQEGILYEKGEQHIPDAPVARGRKKILLDICATYRLDLGMVLEGKVLHAGVSTLWGEIVECQSIRLPTGVSQEELLSQMEAAYHQLLYKNGLTPERITGLGICVDPAYFQRLGISDGPEPDYGPFYDRLSRFVKVPVLCAKLSGAAAVAEADYWQRDQAFPADNALLFRCSSQMDGAVMIGQELYTGSRGRAMRLPDKQKSRAEETFWSCLAMEFSAAGTPRSWQLANGSLQQMQRLAREGRLPMEDEPVRRLAEGFAAQRAEEILYAASFFDPARVILLAAEEREFWLRDYLENRLKETLDVPVIRSRLQPDSLFLAGAALATREFFCNRGGY